MCYANSPLYLQIKPDDMVARTNTPIWYKTIPLGVNSLGKLLPRACEMGGITPRGNHGVRASTVQRLRGAEVPDDKIIQITGHRSARTLAVYDTNQLHPMVHKKCQKILQNLPSETSTCENVDENAPSTSANALALTPHTTPATSANALALTPHTAPSTSANALALPPNTAPSTCSPTQISSTQSVSNLAIRPNNIAARSLFAGANFSNCTFHFGNLKDLDQ